MGFISLKADEIFGPGNAAIAAFLICNALGFIFPRWRGYYSIVLGLVIAEGIVMYGIWSQPRRGLLVLAVGVLNGFLAFLAAGIVSRVTTKVDHARRVRAAGRPLVHDWFE